MAKAQIYLIMEINTQVNIKKANQMERDSIHGRMTQCILENLRMD
jgi:hypothetical protein